MPMPETRLTRTRVAAAVFSGRRQAQRGASLIVALVSLVAMISAAFALFRSVDNANMASANYQFLRSAEQNTDLSMNEALVA